MPTAAPSADDALRFYRAALPVVRFVDRSVDPRLLGSDGDAAWRAYADDLPEVIRCDLVLRHYAILYPAAFAPGPVFRLSGWYDDDPWGAGFDRPDRHKIEAHFSSRETPSLALDAFQAALAAWGVPAARPGAWATALTPATVVVVAGGAALGAVAQAFLAGERLSARAQIVLVSVQPAVRHALGILCALLQQGGVPQLVDPRREGEEDWAAWAKREQKRIGAAGARLLVTSRDTSPDEMEAARALAAALGVDQFIDVEAG